MPPQEVLQGNGHTKTLEIIIPRLYHAYMKTAISIPDEIFARAEQYANKHKMNRSALFTAAVDEYIIHHRDDDVTEKLNAIYVKEDSSLDPVLAEIQHQSTTKEEW